MRRHSISGYALLMVLGLAWLVGQPGARSLSADQAGGLPALEERVADLEATNASQAAQITALQQSHASQPARIAALQDRLDRDEAELTALGTGLMVVEAKTAPILVAGDDFTIIGKNVFIQDGSGATESDTGLGNLTVGYNA